MTATASRLGSSPIAIDWTNLVNINSPKGPATRTYAPDYAEVESTVSKLKNRFHAKDVGFYQTPTENELSQAMESEKLAQSILARGTITDVLFLGIGGSSLGPLSLLMALQEKCSLLRFHVMENPDPIEWKSTLNYLKPPSTLVCCVTKSGTTFETLAQFLCAMEWLGPELRKTNIVAITDPNKGDLKEFAKQMDIPTLHIAPSVGGRFSIFSPVGLFPAALAGLSVKDFLLGAQQVRDYIDKAPTEKNPIFFLADTLIQHAARRPIHVCMPYSTRLKQVSAWFVQLWGESIGKDGKGFTPMAAVGATDQHSILQLLRDGPDDKITWFITVDQVEDPVKIPKAPQMPGAANAMGNPLQSFKMLEGHSLQELLLIEYRATAKVLTRQGRPNFTIQLDRLDERNLGALYFFFSYLTAFTGTHWGVNPFDQPGVEEGKVYIRESLVNARASESTGPYEDPDNSPVARLRRSTE